MYEVTIDRNAKRDLKKLDKSDQIKIISKIEKLRENPYIGKRLSGRLYGLWRLRHDKYRIRYKIVEDKLIVIIIKIKHRKESYSDN